MADGEHQPIVLNAFNGLWARGKDEACPQDHFTDCGNVDYSQSSVFTRAPYTKDFGGNIGILRERLYIANVSGTTTVFILALDSAGNFYQLQLSPTPATNYTTLLASINAPNPFPLDFDLVNINGRAYITFAFGSTGIPFSTLPAVPPTIYVYDGTTIRAAGSIRPVTGTWTITATAGGTVDVGQHSVAVAFESNTGFISSLLFYPPGIAITAGNQTIHMTNIPTGPASTIARRIYVSLSNVSGSINPSGVFSPAQVFLAVRIGDNVTTTFDVTAPDATLLSDGTYLYRIFDQLPCGVGIGKYHNRLVLWGFPTQTITLRTGGSNFQALTINLTPSTILLSNVNDPETIDTLNNYVILDSNEPQYIQDASGNAAEIGVTACQEYRDNLYVFKWTRTFAFTDNGNVPATWKPNTVDEGNGCFINGVMLVLDTGGVNYEYMIICNETGMYTFNGLFVRPEITWKIADLWKTIVKNVPSSGSVFNGRIYPFLDTINKKIYVSAVFSSSFGTSLFSTLLCDYSNSFIGATALTAGKNFSDVVKWSKWGYDNSNVSPTGWVGWEISGIFKFIFSNFTTGQHWVYNGLNTLGGIENVLSPFIQSYLINDGEDNIVHINSVRYRILGNVAAPGSALVTTTIINQDFTRQIANTPFPITTAMGKEPFLWTNLMGQGLYVKTQVPSGAFFDISKIVAYVKKIYATIPT